MLLVLLLLLLGFVLLGLGAELMVRGSSTIAIKLGISPLVIGLTVVAFGTSAPELAVGIESTLSNRSGLALGNVIGSNIANIGLILGLMAIINPLQIELSLVKKQIPLVIGSSIFLWFLLLDQQIVFIDGIFLCLGLVGFLLFSYQQARQDDVACELIIANPIIGEPSKPIVFHGVILIAGLVLLVYGSSLFVQNAIDLARMLGVSEAVIGLSIVAIGTSVPELATSIVAAYKREAGLAVGNVVGSNLFNILGILGITSLIGPIDGSEFGKVDFSVMLAYAFLLLPFAWTNLQISRKEGCILLAGYIAYMYYLFPGSGS